MPISKDQLATLQALTTSIIVRCDDELGPRPSKMNDALNKAVEANAGAQPAHLRMLQAHDVNNEMGALTKATRLDAAAMRSLLAGLAADDEVEVPPVVDAGPPQMRHSFIYGQRVAPRYPTGNFDSGADGSGYYMATIIVPEDAAPAPQAGVFTFAEYQGGQQYRRMSVSTVPGAFDGPNVLKRADGNIAEIRFGINSWDAPLKPGKTYYVNVRNINSTTGLPMAGNFPGSFAVKWPV